MKHNMKRIMTALLAVFMIFGVVGCTSTGSTGKETDGAREETTADVVDATDPGETETEPLTGNFTVSEQDGVASVTTGTQLSYDVTGYESIDASTGIIKFKGDMILTLTTDVVATKFNRFMLTYSSDKPLEVYVKYNEREQEEMFYLEAGTGDFSAVIYDFLAKRYRRDFTSIRVTPCQPGWVNFSLENVSTESVQVPAQTYFIENERFKLGIALHWGGSISYVEDKNCPVEGLTNMVNRHDTGRLIQQSYYGTLGEKDSYEPGVSFGVTWHYNPVQGGDQYGVGGRLIDFVADENSVYIKAQPCDWAKNGSYTPFYMENTYTMEDDYILVDNRAVDFSGWEHPYKMMETPAMYVVSYLDTFVCYNGDKPWTNDDVTIYRDLTFWGDRATQIVYFEDQNTETWYAWYSEEDNFGIGVYVPGIVSVGGGQSQPGVRDKSDMADSTNVGGGGNILRMKSFVPFEYQYILTTGTPEDMRTTFAAQKDFAENPNLSEDSKPVEAPIIPTTEEELAKLDLSKAASNGVIAATNVTMEYDTSEKALKLTTAAFDPGFTITYFTWGFDVRTEDYTTLTIEYMIPETNARNDYWGELYPITGNELWASFEMLMCIDGLIKDGRYHTLTIDLTASPYWNGELNKIRFDHFNTSEVGDVIYIKTIALE